MASTLNGRSSLTPIWRIALRCATRIGIIALLFCVLYPIAATANDCVALDVQEYFDRNFALTKPRGPHGRLSFVEPAGHGSTGARWYVDESGVRWLVKLDPVHPELQTGAEVVSSIIYRYLGYRAAKSVVLAKGKIRASATASLGSNLKTSTLVSGFRDREFRQLRYFAAFLKDWDRLRVGPNNFDLGQGQFAMFDFGGTLGARAQGEHKPGVVVSQAIGAIEGDLSLEQIVGSYRVDWLPEGHPWRQRLSIEDARDLLKRFTYLTDAVLDAAVEQAHYSQPSDSERLSLILKNRRDAMMRGLENFIGESAYEPVNHPVATNADHATKPAAFNLVSMLKFYHAAGYRSHQEIDPRYIQSFQELGIYFRDDGDVRWNRSLKFAKQLGVGSNGVVMLGMDGAVYKFAMSPKKAPALQVEYFVNRDLARHYDRYGIRGDTIHEAGPNGVYLKKQFYDARSFGHAMDHLSPEQLLALRRLYDGAVRYAQERGIGLDIKAENLWWSGTEWILIDCGPRLGYRPFGYTIDMGGFERYLRWWNAGKGAPLNSEGRSRTIEEALAQLNQK